MKKLLVIFALIFVVILYCSTPISFSKEMKEWTTSKSNYENTAYEIIQNDNLYNADNKLNDAYKNFANESEQSITDFKSIENDYQYSFVLIIFGIIILLFGLKIFYSTFIREVLDLFL